MQLSLKGQGLAWVCMHLSVEGHLYEGFTQFPLKGSLHRGLVQPPLVERLHGVCTLSPVGRACTQPPLEGGLHGHCMQIPVQRCLHWGFCRTLCGKGVFMGVACKSLWTGACTVTSNFLWRGLARGLCAMHCERELAWVLYLKPFWKGLAPGLHTTSCRKTIK